MLLFTTGHNGSTDQHQHQEQEEKKQLSEHGYSSKKTLVIAPLADYRYSREEIDYIVSTLNATLMEGEKVNLISVARTVYSEEWDIIWFICHCDQNGIFLRENDYISVRSLITILKNSSVEMVFINGCSSLSVATKVSSETGVTVICTYKEVEDENAYVVGRYLANNIARGYKYYEAFVRSNPSFMDTEYIFIKGSRTEMSSIENLERELDEVRKHVEELKTIMNGDDDKIGLIQVVNEISNSVNNLHRIYKMYQVAFVSFLIGQIILIITILYLAIP
ncbi:MAG: hypothetical protein KatS3mg087_1817 [Patescibacteria group bacterium]|nr:MAG: hypothetical protein KatS3mg087_1817 [Patescibacteria group bacterium]